MSRSNAPTQTATPQTLRRLMKEYDSIRSSTSTSSQGIASNPDLLELRPWDADGQDLFEWYAVVRGPNGGFYQDGHFELSLLIPPSYPSRPPTITFKTPIWHPNIHFKTGEICLDILAKQWSPAWNITSSILAVVALLDAPEPDSPLNVDAALVWRTGDRVAYKSMCRMYTLLHAKAVQQEEEDEDETEDTAGT